MPEKLPENISLQDLRQCVQVLEVPISPYFLKYRQAKTGDVISLGKYEFSNWHPAPRGGVYFDRGRELFRLDLNGQEHSMGEHPCGYDWQPAPQGGVYLERAKQFFHLDLQRKKHSLGRHQWDHWGSSPQGIYFHFNQEFFLLVHKD